MASKASLVNAKSKVRLYKKISDTDILMPYGSNESIVSNYAYLGHFLVLCNQIGKVNYALFRRCSGLDKVGAEKEYFSSSSEVEQREKARGAILSRISENPEMMLKLEGEVNFVYDSINDFFFNISPIKINNAPHIKNLQFCESVFGMPFLESYEGKISELSVKTSSLYVLLQRISSIHDAISSEYGWEEIVEDGYT